MWTVLGYVKEETLNGEPEVEPFEVVMDKTPVVLNTDAILKHKKSQFGEGAKLCPR